jgi:hypothetical protein
MTEPASTPCRHQFLESDICILCGCTLAEASLENERNPAPSTPRERPPKGKP